MGISCCTTLVAILLLEFYSCLDVIVAIDFITSSEFIRDPEFIVSLQKTFKMGFFSPVNSTSRYVRIWYNNFLVMAPIWVANRENPLEDSSGIVKLSRDGNLVVLNGQEKAPWSSNYVTILADRPSRAYLTDDGNLILKDSISGDNVWESFLQPTDTIVQAMRLHVDEKRGFDPSRMPQLFIWNGSRPYWRSVPWNGQAIIGAPNMSSVGFNVKGNDDGSYSQYWDEEKKAWEHKWQIPKTLCDVYGTCGELGTCNATNSPICSCLPGFVPKIPEEWDKGNWTGGCVRRSLLQCDRKSKGDQAGKRVGFVKLAMVKLPDFSRWSPTTEKQCEQVCLKNCSCTAYSYYPGFGCILWTGNLIDLQRFQTGGANLFVRVSLPEFESKRSNIAIVCVRVTVTVVAICVFLTWRLIAKHREWKRKGWAMLLPKRKRNRQKLSNVNNPIDSMSPDKLQEMTFFSLRKLATATDNFALYNKLGEGGFGPVYKGNFPDVQEIDMKPKNKRSTRKT